MLAMAGRVSVSPAARIARVSLTEMLYVLNLAIGENEGELSNELSLSSRDDFQYTDKHLLLFHISLSDQYNACTLLALKQSLHRRQRHRLISRDHLALQIAGRK